MIEQDNLQKLRESLSIKSGKQGLKHTINKKSSFLPFSTRGTERAKFRKGFKGVVGGFTRYISSKKLENNLDIEELIKNTSGLIEMSSSDKPYFEKILRTFLQDKNNDIKIFHPHIFYYLPFTEGHELKGEQEISKFLANIFGNKSDEFNSLFKKDMTGDLVAKLILNELNQLEDIAYKSKYVSKLPYLSNTFKEDFLFLTKHEDYFKNQYELFLSYYYFTYITQLTLKMTQKSKASFQENNEVYYTLDWESTSRNRKGYEYGYKMIKNAARNLLIHINVLEQLNLLMDTDDSKTYPELLETYLTFSEKQQQLFLEILKEWLKEYRQHLSLSPFTEKIEFEYNSLVEALFSSIEEAYQKATMQGPRNRYPLSIEEIGKKSFLKTRGSLGYMLNISQDLFLLLLAVCLKDERKSLKQVFYELEYRGLCFDRYSKEEIVKLLDKLNLLDKKSDSGDAQYVKPVL